MKLFFIRHGQTSANLNQLHAGQNAGRRIREFDGKMWKLLAWNYIGKI